MRKVGRISTCDVLILPTYLIRDVTRFVVRVAQRGPHVLTLPTFLIRDVTRFVTRVTQRVPHVLTLPTFLIRELSLLLQTW
jgi:3-deoxy-D-manno-octulosonic acid (KDO) 8-phosphate synthase